jgi:hypothetical protein
MGKKSFLSLVGTTEKEFGGKSNRPANAIHFKMRRFEFFSIDFANVKFKNSMLLYIVICANIINLSSQLGCKSRPARGPARREQLKQPMSGDTNIKNTFEETIQCSRSIIASEL